MFSRVSDQLRKDIESVKSVIRWQSELREGLLGSNNFPRLEGEETGMPDILPRHPDKIVWQLFDHYAAISRVYALFENAVFDVVEEFLQMLPSITPKYGDLPDRLKTQHRVGVGQVLTKWNAEKVEFASLQEREIASGLVDGLRDSQYQLLAQAFFLAPENLRSSALGRLFADLGFDNAFAYVTKASPVQSFLNERFGDTETAESLLNDLVKIRNEAAHGSTSELASAAKLLNYADFVVVVVDALSNLLLSRSLQLGVNCGRFVEIGKIIHVFSKGIVGLKALTSGKVTVGDSLFCSAREPSSVKVASLRIKDAEHDEIEFSPEMEFGIGLDKKLVLQSSLIRC